MAAEEELQRLVVRLVGDASKYRAMLKEAEEATKKSTTALGHAQLAAQRVQKSFERTGAAIRSAGQNMMRVGRSMSLYVTGPILAAGAAIFKVGGDFEAEMSKIVGLVGVARTQVAAWSEEILNLAPAVGKGPGELSKAMFFVTSAGFRGQKAMDVLEASAKASSAGLGETAIVADAVTSAVNAYTHQNLTAAKATDILVAAVREGKLEAASLSPVMGRVLPIASAMGVSFADVAGALAVMSRTGTDAAMGATAITAMLLNLQKPTDEAREMLDSVGISFQQLRDLVRQPGGIIAMLRLLDEKFKGNEEAMASLIPNVRALRGTLTILAQDASIVDSVMQGVTNSAGSTQRAFDEAAKDTKFQFHKALAELQVMLIKLGGTVLPMMTKALGVAGSAAKSFGDWWRTVPEGLRQAVTGFLGVIAAIGPVLIILGSLGVVIGLVTTGLGILATSLVALVSPAGLIAAGVLLLVGLVAQLVAEWSKYNAIVKEGALITQKMIDTNKAKADQDKTTIQDLQKLSKATGLSKEQMDSAQRTVDSLEGFYGDLGVTINRTTGEVEGLGGAMRKMEASGRRMEKLNLTIRLRELKEEYDTAQKNSNKFWSRQAHWREEAGKLAQAITDVQLALSDVGQMEQAAARAEPIARVIDPIKGFVETVKAQGGTVIGAGLDTAKWFGEGLRLGGKGAFEEFWKGLGPTAGQRKRAQAIIDQFKSPAAKLRDTLHDLLQLQEVGAFRDAPETFARAAKAAEEEFKKALGGTVIPVSYTMVEAARAGTVEAASRMAQFQAGKTMAFSGTMTTAIGTPTEKEAVKGLLERIADAVEETAEKPAIEAEGMGLGI